MAWELEGDGRVELAAIDLMRRWLDHMQDQVLDAIQSRERRVCHWCGTRIAEGVPHCGADWCTRKWETERFYEANL